MSKDGDMVVPDPEVAAAAKAFGDFLANAIALTGYATPTAWARSVPVSPSAVSRWINGKERPSPRLLERIAPHIPGETDGHADVRDLIALAYPEGVQGDSPTPRIQPIDDLAARANAYLGERSHLPDGERAELRQHLSRLLDSFSSQRTG